MKRMRLFFLGGAAIALLWIANPICYSADTDHADIKAEITKRHDEAVKRLQDWIAQVSIAAENRGYPEGAEYMPVVIVVGCCAVPPPIVRFKRVMSPANTGIDAPNDNSLAGESEFPH